MQPQEINKATEYAREMKRMAEISDINHIYKQNYNSDSRSNNNRNTYNTKQGIKDIFTSSSSGNKNNSDISLILALILLLSSDGGDKMLILALLYIMT